MLCPSFLQSKGRMFLGSLVLSFFRQSRCFQELRRENFMSSTLRLITTGSFSLCLFQLVTCSWRLNYNYMCQPVNYSRHPDEMRVSVYRRPESGNKIWLACLCLFIASSSEKKICCLSHLISLSNAFSSFLSDCCGPVVVLHFKTDRISWHYFLRVAEEEQSDFLSSRVPSCYHVPDLVDGHQVGGRWIV